MNDAIGKDWLSGWLSNRNPQFSRAGKIAKFWNGSGEPPRNRTENPQIKSRVRPLKIAFDAMGTLWCAVQSNSIGTLAAAGEVRVVAKNDSKGPLEVPTAIVFVGSRGDTNNHDTVGPPTGTG